MTALSPKALEAARGYWPLVQTAAKERQLPATTLLAIMWRESLFGLALTPSGPSGTGDAGHGHGLMQIDDRAHADWIASSAWKDPAANVRKAAEVLAGARDYFKARRYADPWPAAIAAYNAGCGRVHAAVCAGHRPDEMTTGRDYGAWVQARAKDLEAMGFTA